MKRTGIMLAAGEATRMPNKALLPVNPQGRLVIETGLDFLKASQCDDVIIIVKPDTGLEYVMSMMGRQCNFAYQVNATGPLAAINIGASCIPADEYLVAFCDNIYTPSVEFVGRTELAWMYPRASVRKVPEVLLPACDWWDPFHKEWTSRRLSIGRCGDDNLSFAGWLLLSQSHINAFRGSEGTRVLGLPMHQYLQHMKATPVVCAPNTWHDAGTPESYIAFLKEMNRARSL